MIVGVIKDTSLVGRRIILEPRTNLDRNEYLVERGVFLTSGEPEFALHCLVCEKQIPAKGCLKCNEEKDNG